MYKHTPVIDVRLLSHYTLFGSLCTDVFAVLYFSENVQEEESCEQSADEGSVREGEEQGLVCKMQSRRQ